MLSDCNHAGILQLDFDLMSTKLRENIDSSEFFSVFGKKVSKLRDDKIFIPAFIRFQYGALSPDNKVHNSVLGMLLAENINYSEIENQAPCIAPCIAPYIAPYIGAKDKDKEKEKEKEKKKTMNIDFLSSELNVWLSAVRDETKKRWLKDFCQEVLTSEITKAYEWHLDHNCKVKAVGSFLSNWLSKVPAGDRLSMDERIKKADSDLIEALGGVIDES